MSWCKNTINQSELNAVKRVLDHFKIMYKESIIAKFEGNGLNDMYKEDPTYYLRRLEYNNKIILEYVEINLNPDFDDIVKSTEFNLEDEPKDWKPIRQIDLEECIYENGV